MNICKDVVDEQRKLFHLTDDNQYRFVVSAHDVPCTFTSFSFLTQFMTKFAGGKAKPRRHMPCTELCSLVSK